MLVLSRRVNEVVKIGDTIEVCVVEIRAGVVRLGFTAPSDVSVHRLEVWNAIQEGRKASHEDVVDP